MSYLTCTIIFLVSFVGCASHPPHETKRFKGPNQRDAYSMDCSKNLAGCRIEASILCPKGYNTLKLTDDGAFIIECD